jgi:hypothetical protein
MARVVMVENFQDPDSTENINVVFIHNKPTQCTNVFVSYLRHNTTLDIPTCFGPQRTFIRDKVKVIQHTKSQSLLFTVVLLCVIP